MAIALRSQSWMASALLVTLAAGLSDLLIATPPSDSGLEIVERSIEVHGGPLFTSSQSRLELCSRSGCFATQTRIEGGSFEIEAEGKVRDHQRRVRITNTSVELWQDHEVVEIPEDGVQSMRDWVMARVYFVYLPFRLRDPSVVLEDLGTESWDDRMLRKVKVSFEERSSSGADDEFLFWFDPKTARLEQFAYSFAGNPGGLRFRRAFNYRRVGGILFFDQENWGLDGEGLTVDMIDEESVRHWTRVSTVTLEAIEVEPLAP